MEDIKAYRPQTNSISSGQVLKEPYSYEKAGNVVREMIDNLSLDLVSKKLKTDQIVLAIGYDSECAGKYNGELVSDWYGRAVPRPAHGSVNLGRYTSSTSHILESVMKLYDRITDKNLTVRRLNITANHVITEEKAQNQSQPTLFDVAADDEKERRIQESILKIKSRYGKNSILKGMNFEEGATAMERNSQIGGHKA